ncbi:ABC-type polysaccharide/polyol phosphate transport system, ATPase component [Chthonomonas calidirosea]|uniref:ABC-type polysaccharide/polyol phosphate transport system, ATPase component n=1 Tax=Chthonomonas calidirosea (strain DSM 23976 / ICMP 18418 / T49) TaxID=1303518 RepID=S0EWF4_CHTCT|nr:polysaccharide ABC transporter ATP-binding protein [Chthonomonas calidirosea]CCW36221.1 ABC-type polysaccharide/polyol phosphate transport system, ATPase component [Chthonomonas calidirosea T49]CEK16916.1 ABC-type polysaccharide/polyol phosphate transport system, ATPase component [Chthonomonas calidirosea]CEK17978.1 ABC-type polysaccharide/polyol phosphate transport system, ATPase component [Chthonomonas calidirosea]
MPSANIALAVQGLSKAYRIAHNRETHLTLVSALAHKLRHFNRSTETFWALKDVNLEIQQGEVVGIIGKNGAGKSTLLKVLSRITTPTRGRVDLYGRVGSLLEVGTGFHGELTGRENIYLNGAILGMSRSEIRRQFDAIVEFAGVEKFLDTPVKRYSSGMYVRLAFAVAAHLRTEIMIVDEVLAVGDAEFQQKCLGKMKDVASGGRTVLFVSHNMQAVSRLCTRGVCLRSGEVVYDGDVEGAIERYLAEYSEVSREESEPERRPGSGEYRFVWVKPVKEVFAPEEEKVILFRIERRKERPIYGALCAQVFNELGASVCLLDDMWVKHRFPEGDAIEGSLRIRSPWFKPGTYRIDIQIHPPGGHEVIDYFADACSFVVSPQLPYSGAAPEEALKYGTVLADFDWNTRVVTLEEERLSV